MGTDINYFNYARRVLERCEELSLFSETTEGMTRRFLTEPMKDVHKAVGNWMKKGSLQVSVDNVGNIIGKSEVLAGKPTLLLGSHLDTVVNAGKYDGILGVLLPLTLMEIFREHALASKYSIEVIGFSDEEGARYGSNFLGSLHRTGQFEEQLLSKVDSEGVSMEEAIRSFGGEPQEVVNFLHNYENVCGYVEIHIEQGPVLETHNLPLGIVKGIIGQSQCLYTFLGKAGHAGTYPMNNRQDSLLLAAQFIQYVNERAIQKKGLVATCGKIHNFPNASNVISDKTTVVVDVRSEMNEDKSLFLKEIFQYAQAIAKKSKGEAQQALINTQDTVYCSESLIKEIKASFVRCGIAAYEMMSGAGHDALIMASKVPMAMLFVRCDKGISHHPDENISTEDVAKILEVLVNLLTENTDK